MIIAKIKLENEITRRIKLICEFLNCILIIIHKHDKQNWFTIILTD